MAKANGILASASAERQAANVIQEAHDAITAVFTADRDTDGYVRVKEKGLEIGQIFLPDTSINEGLRQIAQGLLDGKTKDLPLQVRQTIAWLMTALDAKLFIEGTTDGVEPEVNLHLWVSSSNQLHSSSSAASSARPALLL